MFHKCMVSHLCEVSHGDLMDVLICRLSHMIDKRGFSPV